MPHFRHRRSVDSFEAVASSRNQAQSLVNCERTDEITTGASEKERERRGKERQKGRSRMEK